jgi:hypothetical protein
MAADETSASILFMNYNRQERQDRQEFFPLILGGLGALGGSIVLQTKSPAR